MTITYCNATPYEPKELTDSEISQERKVQIGENFYRLQSKRPEIYSSKVDPISTINEAKFHPIINKNLSLVGITDLTSVQKYSIPNIYLGTDVVVISPTGTGKTASYLLPILSNFLKANTKKSRCPYALILAPTHELAIQILHDAKRFLLNSNKSVRIVYGGANTKSQINRINRNGCDILIGTPGRVNTILEKNNVSLAKCRYIVLDEADRLMEYDFPHVVYKIMYRYYDMCKNDQRQTLIFSATFTIKNLELLFEIFLVDSNFTAIIFNEPNRASDDVTQKIELVPMNNETYNETNKFPIKRHDRLVELLQEDLQSGNNTQNFYAKKTLVFVNRKIHIDGMQVRLDNAGIPLKLTGILHGDLDQEERETTLKQFTDGLFPILIASTVAAHGLDIVEVDHVINFDLPYTIAEYVQRIGRTGRLGNRGLSTSFYDPNNIPDQKIRVQLIQVLSNAQQEVPEFLYPSTTKISGYGKFQSIHKEKVGDKLHIDVLNLRMKLVNYEADLKPDMKQANIIYELTIN